MLNNMYLYRKMIIFVFILLFLVYLILLSTWSPKNLRRSDFSVRLNTQVLDRLENVSDSRVRLSKIIGRSVLGPISMWVAFPRSDVIVPGSGWYNPLWDKHDINGFRIVDDIISLSPCKKQDKIFIQIGAHLGIYPLFATYRGCYGIVVEQMPAAVNLTRISATVNNWGLDKFSVINAIVSNKNAGPMWLNPAKISISKYNYGVKNKIRIPMTTLDALNDKYGNIQKGNQSRIAFVIINVEGEEQNVLLGAKRLIQQQSVLIFQIEVWARHRKKRIVSSFPGFKLLIENGYRLYTTAANSKMSFTSCDEVTHRLSELPAIADQACRQLSYPKGDCFCEVYAVRDDLPSLRKWLSSCPK